MRSRPTVQWPPRSRYRSPRRAGTVAGTSRSWAVPTSASRRCSTASSARSWPSSRPSRRPRATGSSASTTATAARSSSSTRPACTARKKGLNRFMVDEAMGVIPDVDAALLVIDADVASRRSGRQGRARRPRDGDPARARRGAAPGRAGHQQGRHGEGRSRCCCRCSSAWTRNDLLRAIVPDVGAPRAPTSTAWSASCGRCCPRGRRCTAPRC